MRQERGTCPVCGRRVRTWPDVDGRRRCETHGPYYDAPCDGSHDEPSEDTVPEDFERQESM